MIYNGIGVIGQQSRDLNIPPAAPLEQTRPAQPVYLGQPNRNSLLYDRVLTQATRSSSGRLSHTSILAQTSAGTYSNFNPYMWSKTSYPYNDSNTVCNILPTLARPGNNAFCLREGQNSNFHLGARRWAGFARSDRVRLRAPVKLITRYERSAVKDHQVECVEMNTYSWMSKSLRPPLT